MSTLSDARKYIANGWSVFPIPYGKKEPIIKWGQFRERYATDEELIEWFGTSKSNIGIATGRLSNLTVLDADGTTGIKELGDKGIVSVGTVITGSGGKQLFFQHSGESNKWTSKDHEGLDSRGEGGYVVAAPSLHPSGMVYRWVGQIPNANALPSFPSHLFPQPSTGTNGVSVIPEPWVVDALKGVRLGQPRHGVLIRLLSYWIPRHSYDVVKHMALEWNQKNDEPYPEAKVIQQVNDISSRFAKGQYKSTYVPPILKELPYVSKENLEISTPKDDADSYLTRVSTTPAPPELPTGFVSLDEATWGLHRGDVFTIGARPGTGKTSFAINVASHLCKAGKRVLYFSTEMSKDELYNAISSSEGGVDAFRLTNKQLNDADKRQLVGFLPQLKTYDIHHVKFFSPDIAGVTKAVEDIQPDLLVIDHLQHIASGENKYAQIDLFMKFLKKLAMEKQIAVLVASQLKRRDDGLMPTMNDLKECGTIEEESSIVILMHKEKKDSTTPVLFRIDKNRHGKCGDTTLLFEGSITTFKDMAVKVA